MTEETGAFCNLFGGTPRNRILEFFLEMRGMDYGIGDVAREAGLNRATTYNTMEELLKSGLIIPTRKLGKTQLYSLDLKNSEAQFLIKIFDRVLEYVVASYEEKHHSKKGLILEA